MKNLLILISLLLLSPFLTSCEKNVEVVVEKLVGEEPIVVRKTKGTLFRDTPYSKFVEGGKKWFKTGDEKTQVKYEGDILNGVPDGFGSFTVPNGDKFVGEYKDGVKNGQGTYTWSDGRKYVGEWKDGVKNGQGTSTYTDGSKYVGELKDGEPWEGKKYHKNGKINFLVLSGKVIYK